jgi:hypothetical protein
VRVSALNLALVAIHGFAPLLDDAIRLRLLVDLSVISRPVFAVATTPMDLAHPAGGGGAGRRSVGGVGAPGYARYVQEDAPPPALDSL